VFPMSFAEFLVAKGQTLLLEAIFEKKSLSEIVKEKAIRFLSEYFVIGGLPEIVASWVSKEQPLEINDLLKSIISSYRQNLEKYKVIFFDVAITQQLLGLDIKGWLLNPKEEFINQGPLVESFIGQEMMAYSSPSARNNLFYWQREARGSEAEIDYLTVIKG